MIDTLKNLTVTKYNIEELIELRAQARQMFDEFAEQQIEKPAWLNEAVVTLDKEIKSKSHDERSRKLSELRARKASMRTAEEKRNDIDREIEQLESVIG